MTGLVLVLKLSMGTLLPYELMFIKKAIKIANLLNIQINNCFVSSGLAILYGLLQNVWQENSAAQSFYQTYYTDILQHVLSVVTDTSHTAGKYIIFSLKEGIGYNGGGGTSHLHQNEKSYHY